jgi:hypothetical protein
MTVEEEPRVLVVLLALALGLYLLVRTVEGPPAATSPLADLVMPPQAPLPESLGWP